MLQRWRVGRTVNNRLRDAVTILDEVAAHGSFDGTVERQLAVVASIALTLDFFQIAQCLNGEPLSVVTQELSLAIDARVGTSGQRRSLEYQSQYWATMVLASTHKEPRLPPASLAGNKPDFILDVGGIDVAVEVKRPESHNSARDALDRAAGQLRGFGEPGFIFLDVTDCVVTEAARRTAIAGRTSLAEEVSGAFFTLAHALGERPRKYNQSDKYARILGVAIYARAFGWQYAPRMQPVGEVSVLLPLYESACQGLVRDQARLLSRLILQGIEAVNGSAPERVR